MIRFILGFRFSGQLWSDGGWGQGGGRDLLGGFGKRQEGAFGRPRFGWVSSPGYMVALWESKPYDEILF